MINRTTTYTVDTEDYDKIKEIAETLGITPQMVCVKALLLMGLHAELKIQNKGCILLKEGDRTRELLIT